MYITMGPHLHYLWGYFLQAQILFLDCAFLCSFHSQFLEYWHSVNNWRMSEWMNEWKYIQKYR